MPGAREGGDGERPDDMLEYEEYELTDEDRLRAREPDGGGGDAELDSGQCGATKQR